MTKEIFNQAYNPKVFGAKNLIDPLINNPEKKSKLDFIILFSSVSAIAGNIGQSNYVSANTFLDSYAHYLSNKGIPTSSINLGVVNDVGAVANDTKLKKKN